MIRIFKLVLLLVVSQVAFGQAPSNYTNINGRYRWIAGMFDSTFHIPKGTTPSLRTGGSTNSGGLFYNTSDSSVYTYTGTQWIKVRGSLNPSDTTNKYITQVYKKSGSDSVFYVKGGVHTWAFNDSTGAAGGGGGGKIYYFNGGVNMGTFGGFTMYELGDTANTGAAANFTRNTTGNIANFITDANKPGLLQIPAGVWTVDAWMSETGGGANHAQIWAVLEKWNGSTITTIATSPIEEITEGNTPNLYTWAITVPTTSLAVTDRIIIQFYITNTNGKTVTLYTQNGYVGEVHTTFTTGIGALNGLTAASQYLTTGTSGTDFNISSVTATHTFNLPTASATNRGALSTTDWSTFNSKLSPADTVSLSNRINLKLNISDTAAMLSPYARTNVVNAGLATKVNISDTASMLSPYARKNFLNAGTGISYSSTTGTIANTAPDQTVALNAGTGISISGTYPNFTITNSSPSSGGTVTSVGSNTGTGLTGGPITTAGTLAIDTTLISTRAWRQKGVDSLQANINLKLNISDTASMLSPYLRSNTAAATYVPQTRTITINGTSQDLSANRTYNVGTVTSVATSAGTGITGGTFTTSGTIAADTLLLSTRAWRQKGIDSVAALPRVTSVATNTATGITGGTIVSTGTLAIDTTLISTRLWRQKGVDSVAGLLSGYVPNSRTITINGTSQDLSANRTFSVGTVTSVGSGYGLSGGAITGSGTLLVDSATLSNYYLRRKDSLTATNLLGYVTGKILADTAAAVRAAAGAGTIGGSGTANRVAKFTASGTIGNSSIADSSSSVAMTITSAGTVSLTSSITATQGIFRNSSVGAIQAIRDLNVTSVGAAGQRIEIGALNGTTPTAGAAIDGVLENPATTGYMVFNTRTASSLTEKMRLDASGNLGLGVTPSAWGSAYRVGLQVGSSSIAGVAGAGASDYFSIGGNYYLNSSVQYIYNTSTFANRLEASIGEFRFYTAPSGTAGNAISFTQAMTLNASGNLGIGTATIGSRLQVNGNAAIGYSASTAAPTNGLVVSGNVGINTTSVSNTLEVNGTGRFQGSASGSAIFINNQAAGGTAQNYIDFTAGATNIVRFSRGNAAAGLEANGLNIDNFAGFKVRLNQLGGTGGNFTIDNGGLFIGNGETAGTPTLGIISGTGGTGSNIAGAEFRIRGGASTGSAAGGPITFYTSAAGTAGTTVNAATERMRIDTRGNVGLGVTPSAWGSGYNVMQMGLGASFYGLNDARYSVMGANIFNNGTSDTYIATGVASLYIQALGAHQWYTAPSGTAGNAITFTQGMTLNASSNLGIGTTTIGSRLQVNGNAAIGYSASTAAPTNGLAVSGNVGIGTTSPVTNLQVHKTTTGLSGVQVTNSTTGSTISDGTFFGIDDNFVYVWNYENTPTLFATNNSERMRITSGGQVTLSTGANVSAIAQTGYSLTGSNASSLIDLAGTWNTTGNPTAIKLNITNTASGASADLMELQIGGTNQFRVTKGGAIETDTPSGGTKKPWKLGSYVTSGSWTMNQSSYVEIEIDGVAYKLALVSAAEPQPQSKPEPKPEN